MLVRASGLVPSCIDEVPRSLQPPAVHLQRGQDEPHPRPVSQEGLAERNKETAGNGGKF